ncbi:MAG: endonuclease domain-containing protein [Lysobacteraceae bacterium]
MDQLRHRARELRNHATDAEQHLWRHLRRQQLGGYRFRRQVPVAGFIADFLCPSAKLIIELDGGQHAEQAASDERRTMVLVEAGYRVIRFWNHDVLIRTDDVLAEILRQLEGGATPPQSSPASQGRERAAIDGGDG